MAEGRDQKYRGSVNGWPISSEPTALPSLYDDAAVGLVGEDGLGDAGDEAGIEHAGAHGQQKTQDDERGTKTAEIDGISSCHASAAPPRSRSISLMPMNGTISPPRP